MMQTVPILGQQSYSAPSPALNFNPSPAVNPMMQPVSILDQQVFNPSQPDLNFDPFSSFNVEPSPAFSFPDPVVNPMMQPVSVLGQQSFNVPQPQVTFRDYDVPEPPRASALSVFTQGGNLKPGIDVNAITPSPQASPSLYAVNTALNQEVPFESQISSGPDFSGAGVSLSPFTEGLLDSLKRGVTQPQFGMRGIDPRQNPYGETLTENPSSVPMVSDVEESAGSAALDTQAAQELSRLMEGVAANSPQANFLAEKAKGDLTSKQIADANAFAKSIGTTFDPELGYDRTSFLESKSGQPQVTQEQLQQLASPGPIAPMGRDATKALIAKRLGLNAPATLNQAKTNNPNAVMATDAQGRMRSFASPQARQQNLTNAQAAFDQASRGRLARLEQRDVRPGETQTERDTRIADSRTEGADRGGEMSFAEARKFIPKGEKESTKAYNSRVKAYQAQQNSRLSRLKENMQELKVTGQELNNKRVDALIVSYARDEPARYGKVLDEAKARFAAGDIKNETEMAVYIIDQMGDDISSVTDKTDSSKSSMIDQVIQSGQGPSNNNSTSPDRVTINSQAEYDRLKPGTAYVDSYGKLGTK